MTGTIIDLAAHRRAIAASSPDADEPYVMLKMKPAKQRWWNFRKAEIYLRYLETLRTLANTAKVLLEQHDVRECAPYVVGFDAEFALRDKIDRARVALMLTPASSQAELALKRRMLAGIGLYFPDLCRGLIAAALDADKEYLAIPRQYRNAALSRKAGAAK